MAAKIRIINKSHRIGGMEVKMADEKFGRTVGALFQGMEAFLTTKTVVGDAVKFEDGTIILPLVDVSFGMGAGSFANGSKNNAGGGSTFPSFIPPRF